MLECQTQGSAAGAIHVSHGENTRLKWFVATQRPAAEADGPEGGKCPTKPVTVDAPLAAGL